MIVNRSNLFAVLKTLFEMESDAVRSKTWAIPDGLEYNNSELMLSLLPFFYLTPLTQKMISFPTELDNYLGRRQYVHAAYLKMIGKIGDTVFEDVAYKNRRLGSHQRPVSVVYSEMKERGGYDFSKLPPPRIAGAISYDEIDGMWLNGSYLKFLHQYQSFMRASSLKSRLNSDHPSILEIGAGFGGLPDMVMHNHPNARYTIVDISTSIALSLYYLFKNYPNKTFSIDFEESPIEDGDESEVQFYFAGRLEGLTGRNFDLCINCESLLEMTPGQISEYFDLIQNQTFTNHFYSYNREWRKEGTNRYDFDSLPYDDLWTDEFNEQCPLKVTELYAPIRERLTVRKRSDRLG